MWVFLCLVLDFSCTGKAYFGSCLTRVSSSAFLMSTWKPWHVVVMSVLLLCLYYAASPPKSVKPLIPSQTAAFSSFGSAAADFLPDTSRLFFFVPLPLFALVTHTASKAAAKTYFGFRSFYFSSLVCFSLNSEMWRWCGTNCRLQRVWEKNSKKGSPDFM